jgi:hypothetical protein
MPMDLASIVKASVKKNWRWMVYGPPGSGKTSGAASCPNMLMLQVEDGTPAGVEFDAVKIKKFSDVMDIIGSLFSEKHAYKTVAIDSLSALQPLIFEEVCARGGKKSIEEFPFGKGYVEAERLVGSELIAGLNALHDERGMNVLLIAHSRIRRFDSPDSQSWDRFEPDLHAKISPVIEREMDAIFLIKDQPTIKQQDVGFNKERAYAEGNGRLFIYTESRPAFVAKNRYGLASKIPYEKGGFYTSIASHLTQTGSK